LVRFVFIYSV